MNLLGSVVLFVLVAGTNKELMLSPLNTWVSFLCRKTVNTFLCFMQREGGTGVGLLLLVFEAFDAGGAAVLRADGRAHTGLSE